MSTVGERTLAHSGAGHAAHPPCCHRRAMPGHAHHHHHPAAFCWHTLHPMLCALNGQGGSILASFPQHTTVLAYAHHEP